MLSLETAEKLKAAGLRWNPQVGDYGARLGKNEYILLKYFYVASTQMDHINTVWCDDDGITGEVTGLWNSNKFVWLPRLGQLLAEIEKRGWEIDLQYFNNGTGWFCEVAKTVQFRHNKPRPKLTINHNDGTTTEVEPLSTCPGWGDYGEKRLDKEFIADSPDEAAAQALIWILEQERRAI